MGWMDQPAVGGDASATGDGPSKGTSAMYGQPVIKDAPAPSRPMWDTEDVGRSVGSGLMRGAAGLTDAVLTGGRPAPGEYTSTIDEDGNFRLTRNDVPPVAPVSNFAREMAPSAMGYEPTSVIGGYGQTLGEFAPGMLFPAGRGGIGTRFSTNVAAPAIASESAGLAARELFPDNESAEAWARLAGGFMGAPIASGLEGVSRTARSSSRVDPHIETLNKNRVDVTAGNVTRNPQLLAREAAAPRTAEILAGQPKQFRDAALRSAGVAIPDDTQNIIDVIGQARKQAGSTYSRVTQGLDIVPSRLHASKMRSIADNYATHVDSGLQSGTIRQIQSAVDNAYRSGVPIPPKQIGHWRSAVSAATRSASPVARQSAIETLRVLDDVIGRSLAQAGRAGDISLLGKARAQYRDILALEGALMKAGKLGDDGMFTPQNLTSSLANQGKEAFMRGRRGEMAELAKAGRARLVPVDRIPQAKPTLAGRAGRIAADTAGSLLGYKVGQYLFPDNANLQYLAGGAGTAAAEGLRTIAKRGSNAVLSSPIVQEAMKRAAQNPVSGANPFVGGAVGAMTAGPQADGGRVERKAGGRVSVDHERLADQLVGAAERAKKGINKGTEQLLSMPDEHIAHALELANRSI